MKCVLLSDMHDSSEWIEYIPLSDKFSYICLGDVCQSDPEVARRNIDGLRKMKDTGQEFILLYGNHDPHNQAIERWGYWAENSDDPKLNKVFATFFDEGRDLRDQLENTQYMDFLEEHWQKNAMFESDNMVVQATHNRLPMDEETEDALREQRGGSLRIINENGAKYQFEEMDPKADVLLLGHSHYPLIAGDHDDEIFVMPVFVESPLRSFSVGNFRFIINPGSLCANREYGAYDLDGHREINSRSYAVLDTEERKIEWEFF